MLCVDPFPEMLAQVADCIDSSMPAAEGAHARARTGISGKYRKAARAKPALLHARLPCLLLQAVQHPRVEPFLMDALRFAALPPEEMSYTHALLKVQ